MTDPKPEILDGIDEPLTDDQMAAARRSVLRLRAVWPLLRLGSV